VQDVLDRIDAWACAIPLPHPLHLGTFSVFERHYVAVRVATRGGLRADVVGHSRGSPLDVALLDVLAPRMLGSNPFKIEARGADFRAATVALERDGIFGRPWSLLELAMQGLRAEALRVPVWQMLGGAAREVAVQLVEGYPLPDESDEDFADRLLERVAEEYTAIKIEAGSYADGQTLLRRLQLIRRAAPAVRLVVDFGWSLRDVGESGRLLKALGEVGVDWIEDPFPRCPGQVCAGRSNHGITHRLRR
jgi:L-alanine-DL-glutamate epimerase-like enolase superfamily enzyme